MNGRPTPGQLDLDGNEVLARATAVDEDPFAVFPDVPVPAHGDWECLGCRQADPEDPQRAYVSIYERTCPFCGHGFRNEYRRDPG